MDRFRDTGESVLSLIPGYYRENDPEQFTNRLAQVIDDEFFVWDGLLDELRNVKDPNKATERQISYLFAEKGFDPPLMASLARRRQVLFDLPSYIKRKGDPRVVRDVIIALTGLGVEAVAFWSDPRYWRVGQNIFGRTTVVGIPYSPRTYGAFVVGYARAGTFNSKIGKDYENRRLVYTIQLRLSRPPTTSEQRAIDWACRYFKRAEDICKVFFPDFASSFWTIGLSRVGRSTKVRAGCWKFGVSLFGKTSIICAPCPAPPSAVVSPSSPGTWVPNFDGGGSFQPIIPVIP